MSVSLKALPSKIDPNIRNALKTLAAAINNQDAAISSAVNATFTTGSGGGTSSSFAIPNTPTGLVVTGLFSMIMLQWDSFSQLGYAHMEVWRADTDNLGSAVLVGTTAAGMYVDTPPDQSISQTYYYWIRAVNQNNPPDYSPYNATAGTPGSTASDPSYLLELLTDEITEGQLYQGLKDDVAKISVNEGNITTLTSGVAQNASDISTEITNRGAADDFLSSRIDTVSSDNGANTAAIQTEATTRASEDSALSSRIDTVVAASGDNTAAITAETTARANADTALGGRIDTVTAAMLDNSAAIQTEQTARADADTALAQDITTLQTTVDGNTTSLQTKAEVSDLNAIYEVKLDVNGRVTGFGLVANDTSTEFGILADRFWIADPNDPAQVQPIPFIVDSGTVYINMAMIKDATITDAKIITMSAEKITAGTITSLISIVGGMLRSADSLVYLDMASKTLKMQDASSGDYVQMTPGSLVYHDSSTGVNIFEFNNGAVKLRNTDGTIILQSGGQINTANLPASVLNSNVTPADVGAIDWTYLANAVTNNFVAANANIANGAITSAKIGTAEVSKLNISGTAYLNGKQLSAAGTGSVSLTTGINDYAQITHNLGRYAVINVWGGENYGGARIGTNTTTSFRIYFDGISGDPQVTSTIYYSYI